MDLRPGPALKRALVTGAHGQDGFYLTELLEKQGYEVVGLGRGDVDLADGAALRRLLADVRPAEVYNLAAPTFVPQSWAEPVATLRIGALAVAALLDAIVAVDPAIRFLQASSAEVFGVPDVVPQTEQTPYAPRSPYGTAKAAADFLVVSYRERHHLHASCAILFNHESPRRDGDFLPVRVARGVAAIAAGRETELALGDLDATRDWGYAADFVRAMWLAVQQPAPDDYVVATGEAHSVRELVEIAFARVGLDWRDHVRVDAARVRGDARRYVGDATKARTRLGWRPSVTFEELVHLLVDNA